MDSGKPTRMYELDWLRVFAILVVFLYHSTRFFNLGDWHIKNTDVYVWVEILNVFVTRWMMPLFFVISGASLFYAIGKFSGFFRFYADKFLRLMIPVLVAVVTHSVLQIYLERSSHNQFNGTFLSFIPEYFKGLYSGIGMSGNFALHGMHLWYLLVLFIYSLLCYPLFIWIKGKGKNVLNRSSRILAMPGLIYLWFSLPFVILKALIPAAVLNVGSGGWGFIPYLWFLIAGFIIISNNQLLFTIKSQRWVSLVLGVILSVAYLFQLFSPSKITFPVWTGDWVLALFTYFIAWSWLLAILGFGMQGLSFSHSRLGEINEGVLPFFILHQTVILSIGYFVMDWTIPDVLKWIIVFISSFVVIIALYLALIRKFELFRFLFGMKTNRPFYRIFRNPIVLFLLLAVYIGLIVIAAVNSDAETRRRQSTAKLTFNPYRDIVLNAETISHRSSDGVRIVPDHEGSIGQVIEFFSGANQRSQSNPDVFIDMQFNAPEGRYFIWIRGKTTVDNAYTDSVWVQVDNQIDSADEGIWMGNWLDFYPVGVFGWAGDAFHPKYVILNHSGEHKIRIQPRQIPHRIDQIWLSRDQLRLPDTTEFIKPLGTNASSSR